jgi:chromosome segregation ATPase
MESEDQERKENPSAGEPQLQHSVQTLSRMIQNMEKQLERMLSINEALENDLEQEKKKTAKALGEHDELRKSLQRADQEVATLGDLQAEIGHLGHERSRLASNIEELGRQLAETEQENRRLERLCERMRDERDDAVEELQSVEAQFDHAMKMVGDLRTRLATLGEERDALMGRVKVLDSQIQMAEEQRDGLRTEVEESRHALDEIRRQVADACVMSQRYYSQQEETE